MTIEKIINDIHKNIDNSFPTDRIIGVLDEIDKSIKDEILDKRFGREEYADFRGYNTTTPTDTELLIKPPYDNIYVHYVRAMANYDLGEFDLYNNNMIMFNTAKRAFWNYYNSHYQVIPKSNFII